MSRRSYSPRVLGNGEVIQAAVYKGGGGGHEYQGLLMTQATVLAVYYTDDPLWKPQGWAADGVPEMVADVRTIGRQSRTLRKVPCAQRLLGLEDEDVYEWRPARLNLQGGTLDNSPPTPAKSTDADYVMVAFIDGNPAHPMVLPFTLGHPGTHRPMTQGKARRRIRICGTSLEWDRQGNITIDATEAHSYELGAKGQPVSSSGVGGQIVLKTKNGSGGELSLTLDATGKATLKGVTEVHLDAPVTELSDTSPHALLFGDTFNAQLQPYLQAEIGLSSDQVTQWNAISGLCTAPPLLPLKAYFEKIAQDWNQYLLALTTMQSAMPTWISQKVKTG